MCQEQRATASASRGQCGLGSGMAAADDYDVESSGVEHRTICENRKERGILRWQPVSASTSKAENLPRAEGCFLFYFSFNLKDKEVNIRAKPVDKSGIAYRASASTHE
jgi:hypothetical protein